MATLRRHPSFQETLDNIPYSVVEHGLELKTVEAHSNYLEVCAGGIDGEARIQAILDVGLVAMAQSSLVQTEHTPRSNLSRIPVWLETARTALSQFIEGDPQYNSIKDSVYFMDDLKVKRQLGDIVSASIVPQGIYTDFQLAAGVAIGDITARPYHPQH